MIVNKDHKLHGKVVLKDCKGSAITMISSWDTVTETAIMWLLARQDSISKKVIIIPDGPDKFKQLSVAVNIPGARLYYIDSGEEVKSEDL